MDWENHLRKNPIQKIEKKTVKIKVKLPHVNKKPVARNRIFVQTPFSHPNLKLERKNFTPQNQNFTPQDQNHDYILTSKIIKLCEQFFKKRHCPNTNQVLWIVKITACEVLKYNSKNRMENLEVLNLTSRSIEQFQPNHIHIISKNWETKRIKQTKKNMIIFQNLKLLSHRQNWSRLKILISKVFLKPNFVFEVGPILYLQDPKKIYWP